MSDEIKHDDGRRWGYMASGELGPEWIELPKQPMLLANMGPPPFDVILPHTGELRRVIHNPDEVLSDDQPPAV